MAATETVPSTREFTFIGIAYGIYVLGLFTFWPLIAGVVLAYIKRSDVAGSFLESHYGWLIRTFWWWSILWALIVAGMLAAIIPNALVLAAAARSGDYFSIPWSILAAAIAGGIALSIVWVWAAYRLVRGVLRLADGRPVP
jgi:uncharacterized membrane protein